MDARSKFHPSRCTSPPDELAASLGKAGIQLPADQGGRSGPVGETTFRRRCPWSAAERPRALASAVGEWPCSFHKCGLRKSKVAKRMAQSISVRRDLALRARLRKKGERWSGPVSSLAACEDSRKATASPRRSIRCNVGYT